MGCKSSIPMATVSTIEKTSKKKRQIEEIFYVDDDDEPIDEPIAQMPRKKKTKNPSVTGLFEKIDTESRKAVEEMKKDPNSELSISLANTRIVSRRSRVFKQLQMTKSMKIINMVRYWEGFILPCVIEYYKSHPDEEIPSPPKDIPSFNKIYTSVVNQFYFFRVTLSRIDTTWLPYIRLLCNSMMGRNRILKLEWNKSIYDDYVMCRRNMMGYINIKTGRV
jgi:hypothetical protein